MKRKLIIEGNAVYEIDEECMLKNRMDERDESREDRTHNENKEDGGYQP
ncbi:hypothetical protein [Luxibacter massiliensis]|nr:hypothetical protein [Luxibacter massiliensis]